MAKKKIDHTKMCFWKQHPSFWVKDKDFTSLTQQQKSRAFKMWCIYHPNTEDVAPIKGVEYYDPITKRSGRAGKRAFHERQQAARWARKRATQNSNPRESTASERAFDQESSSQAASTSQSKCYQPIIKQERLLDTSGESTKSPAPASAVSAQPEAITASTSGDHVERGIERGPLPASQAVVLFNPEHRVSDWLDGVSRPVMPASKDASRKRPAAELDEEPSTRSRKVRATTLFDLAPSVPEAVEQTPLSAFDCGLLKDGTELRLWSLGLQFRSWVTRVA